MTATKDVTVWCDYGYDPSSGHRSCNARHEAPAWTVSEARASARRAGWRYVRGHPAGQAERDLCPNHAREGVR